jgi:hypothetical protein
MKKVLKTEFSSSINHNLHRFGIIYQRLGARLNSLKSRIEEHEYDYLAAMRAVGSGR